MGAALHLAHVHQAPVKKKQPKRTGGGNGGEFAQLAHEIYQDKRADPESRELLLAMAYAITMAPLDEEISVWRAVVLALGPSRANQSRLPDLVRHDIPRYVSPRHDLGWNGLMYCRGPRLRPYKSKPWANETRAQMAARERQDAEDFRNVQNLCGEKCRDTDYALEKLPGTGWHAYHYFCPRHLDHLRRVKAQVAVGNKMAPEPVPNRGGLLPCYFESDWVKVYQFYSHAGDRWQPPVYGVRADDWPIPGKEPVPSRARLRLAALDGELFGGEV